MLPVLTVLLSYCATVCYCVLCCRAFHLTILRPYLIGGPRSYYYYYHPTSQEGQGLTSAPRLKRAKAEALQVRW